MRNFSSRVLMAPDVQDSWMTGGSHRPYFGPERAQQLAQSRLAAPDRPRLVAGPDRVGQHRLVLPRGRSDQMEAGAAPVVGVAACVLQLPEPQPRLERGQVGAVDVQRGHLVLTGRQLGAGPLGAGLPDLVRAARGLLAQDVRQPRVRDDVVSAAFAGVVQQCHGVRDRPPKRPAATRGRQRSTRCPPGRKKPRRRSSRPRRPRRRPRAAGRAAPDRRGKPSSLSGLAVGAGDGALGGARSATCRGTPCTPQAAAILRACPASATASP